MRRYVADFETLTLEAIAKQAGEDVGAYHISSHDEGILTPVTEVWAWALVPCEGPYTMDNVITGTDIKSFVSYLTKHMRTNDEVYFHNLSFDGTFLLSYLINKGLQRVEYTFHNRWQKGWDVLSGEQAGYYSIELTLNKAHFKIIDSLKLLPFSVYQIGTNFKTSNQKLLIDYDGHTKAGIPLTKQEREYVANDVLVVAEALQRTYFDEGMNKITVGSNALNEYQTMLGGKAAFRELFPQLDPDIHDYCQKAYRGGICYVRKGIESKVYKDIDGYVYDVHSMYPSVMHSASGNAYPVGEAHHFDGKGPDDKLWIGHIKAELVLKKDHMPCLQLKRSGRWADNEYIEDTEGVVDLYCTSVDWKAYTNQYDVYALTYVDGYWFDSEIGLFDNFIDKWYTVKRTSKGAVKQRAKLMLNNLYGKFSTATNTVNLRPYLDSKGILKHEHIANTVDSIYMPVGAFVTAYARYWLVESAQKNWTNFLYCDTDSIHLKAPSVGITVTDDDLYTWGIESTFTSAKYLRQKTYMEVDADGHKEVKCAGLPRSKPVMDSEGNVSYEGPRNYLNFDNFDFEYDFASDPHFNSCKLQKVRIKGGIILVNGPWSIRK